MFLSCLGCSFSLLQLLNKINESKLLSEYTAMVDITGNIMSTLCSERKHRLLLYLAHYDGIISVNINLTMP